MCYKVHEVYISAIPLSGKLLKEKLSSLVPPKDAMSPKFTAKI